MNLLGKLKPPLIFSKNDSSLFTSANSEHANLKRLIFDQNLTRFPFSGFIVVLIAVVTGTTSAQTAQDCINVACRTYDDVNTLWCHADPAHFCQCRPSPGGTWVPQVMPCAPGTLYSFRRQTCVHPPMYDDRECDELGPEGGELELAVCEEVPCVTYAEVSTLVCHEDRTRFCQCRPLKIDPTVWVPVVMHCAESTSFSFRHQTCTRDELWLNSCWEFGTVRPRRFDILELSLDVNKPWRPDGVHRYVELVKDCVLCTARCEKSVNGEVNDPINYSWQNFINPAGSVNSEPGRAPGCLCVCTFPFVIRDSAAKINTIYWNGMFPSTMTLTRPESLARSAMLRTSLHTIASCQKHQDQYGLR